MFRYYNKSSLVILSVLFVFNAVLVDAQQTGGNRYGIQINEICASNLQFNADECGEYDDWVELYNASTDTINLRGFFVSDSHDAPFKYQINRDTLIPPQAYCLLWADSDLEQGELHMSFKLSADGETFYLFSPEKKFIDSVQYKGLNAGVTYACLSDEFNDWAYVLQATPGSANPVIGASRVLTCPYTSAPSGFYENEIQLQIIATDPNTSVVHYTLDGTEPTVESVAYKTPLVLKKNTVLRFRAFSSSHDSYPSRIISQVYLFDNELKLDVLSVVTDETELDRLFDLKDKGTELISHIDYFGVHKRVKFAAGAGLRLHSPKKTEQYSMKLYARGEYGSENFKYALFNDRETGSYKRLIVRNAGNDCSAQGNAFASHFKDGFHQDLFQQMGHGAETSAYKPVHVYVNAAYRGIFNIRERIDKYYVEKHFGEYQNYDLLERTFGFDGNRNAIEGDFAFYDSIMSFIATRDLSIDENYDSVCRSIDVGQFADYWIHEVYIGNYDWLNNNIKMFRPKLDGAKFRWLLWDTDCGSGSLFSANGRPTFKSLSWSLSTEHKLAEKGKNNLLHRNLIKNKKFKQLFVNRFADLLNTVYQYSNIVSTVDSFASVLRADMPLQAERWQGSVENWEKSVVNIKKYYAQRADYIRDDIKDCFALDSTFQLTIMVTEGGVVRINTLLPDFNGNSWTGEYFTNIPIALEAIPKKGFEFSHWEGSLSAGEQRTIDSLFCDTLIKAVFVSDEKDIGLKMSELMFSSTAEEERGCVLQWIELKNESSQAVDLTGWKLISENSEFALSATQMKNGSYAVVYTDLVFDQDGNIRLQNSSGETVDSVSIAALRRETGLPFRYDFSFERFDAFVCGQQIQKWKASTFLGGTPGRMNSTMPERIYSLRINEAMARNDGQVLDEYMQKDDWIELYNAGSQACKLSGLFITDNKSDILKWQIPDSDLVVPSNGYTLLWADNEIYQGLLHLNFKLSEDGEQLRLFQNNGYELIEIDRFKLAPFKAGKSYGAFYDGITAELRDLAYLEPSPRSANMFLPEGEGNPLSINHSVASWGITSCQIKVYPNPAGDFVQLYWNRDESSGVFELHIYDCIGRECIFIPHWSFQSNSPIDVESLPNGMYFIAVCQIQGPCHKTAFYKGD